ncbi:hypothetical protein RJ55_07016 [Drechmeria coniospora]|nr:hypothetical protein RJ55_07016 [Drechmeria coniospora]
MPRPTKITIHTGGESSRSTSYNSEEDLSHNERDISITDEDDEWDDQDDFYDGDEDLFPSDSASASNEGPPVPRQARARAAPRRHRLTRQQPQYPPVQVSAPILPSVDPSEEFGHYGQGYQPQPAQRAGHFAGRGGHPQPYPGQNHYMGGYPAGNQMVPYGSYGPNPFSPMSNSSSGASYFGGEQRLMYDMMPYQQQPFYGAPQYSLPAHMQQFHLSPPPPPATEAPAQPPTPAPKEPPVDVEKIKMEAQLAAIKAHEDRQRALDEQRERDTQIRKEAEEAFMKKMDEMKKQQEEAQKEIARARAEAERAAVERVEAERRAADDRAKQEAEAMRRAEENAMRKFEAEMKAAEDRRKKEAEDRVRIEEAAKARLEAAMKAEADAKIAAEKKVAEEAERLKLIQEDAKRKAEADAAAKIEADKEAAKKKAEADEAAKKEHEALKKKIQEETKAKLEEAAKKASDKAPIKFKDAVGRKFSFPFHLCKTWQGIDDLIKQAFLHVEVIGPHVQQGHFDLIGPNGEIILPTVWEKVIEPDWSISMVMWPVEKMPPAGPKLPPGMMPGAGGRRGHMPGIPIPGPMSGVPSAGRPAGGIPPLAGWSKSGNRRPPDIDIVEVAPAPAKSGKSSSKKNSAMLTFFAGRPAKKKSSKK